MISKKNRIDMAKEIVEWCKSHELWQDIAIYHNGVAWADNATWGEESGKPIEYGVYEYAGKNPKDYMDYANPDTVSMSFEGPLYEILNGFTRFDFKMQEEFRKIFDKYGYYYELGNSWNLSCCER